MLSGGKRVAYARIPAQHVIYSQTDYERGRDSGRLQTVFLRVFTYWFLIYHTEMIYLERGVLISFNHSNENNFLKPET